jgi:hypothetical protein
MHAPNKGLVVVITVCLPLVALAQGAAKGASSTPASDQTKSATAAPPSDQTNYIGDQVIFHFAISASRVDMTQEKRPVSAVCLPAHTRLRGIGNLKIDNDTAPAFTVVFVPSAAVPDKKDQCTAPAQSVGAGDVVVIKQDDLTSTPPDRYGLTYGTLLVPFKYHFVGDKSFSAESSVGGYLGWRQDRTGFTGLALQYVVFLGATSISVLQTTNGSTNSQNMTGVSYGLGLLGTVKGNFHMGIVIGADRVNSSANYANNGKLWGAVSLGYAFSN